MVVVGLESSTTGTSVVAEPMTRAPAAAVLPLDSRD
jgi:hypothetical protein